MTNPRARIERIAEYLTPSSFTDWAGDHVHGFDVAAIIAEYNARVDEAIDAFIREYPELFEQDDPREIALAWHDYASSLDDGLAEIAEKHDNFDAMSSASFSADLHVVGLTATSLGEVMLNASGSPVDPRRVRQWCDGDRPIPAGVWEKVRALRAEHDSLVAEWRDAEATIEVPKAPRPPRWYIAAAARVRDRDPQARFIWE